MKALTLHQPWAQLVALGAKLIETRPWHTRHRGPLAIHASMRRPPLMHLPPLQKTRDYEADEWHNHRTWAVVDVITDPAHQRPHRTDIRDRVPRRSMTPTLFLPHAGRHGIPNDPKRHDGYREGGAIRLPLGAVVATCYLVGCVPVERLQWRDDMWSGPMDAAWAIVGDSAPMVDESQRALGDFRPGRYAWLLADVQPVDPPAPARGYQGLWSWTPEIQPTKETP